MYNISNDGTSSRFIPNWIKQTRVEFFSAKNLFGLRRNMRCHSLVASDTRLIWTGSIGAVLRAVFTISSIMRFRPRGISVRSQFKTTCNIINKALNRVTSIFSNKTSQKFQTEKDPHLLSAFRMQQSRNDSELVYISAVSSSPGARKLWTQPELDHVDQRDKPFALDSLTKPPVRTQLYLFSDISNTVSDGALDIKIVKTGQYNKV